MIFFFWGGGGGVYFEKALNHHVPDTTQAGEWRAGLPDKLRLPPRRGRNDLGLVKFWGWGSEALCMFLPFYRPTSPRTAHGAQCLRQPAAVWEPGQAKGFDVHFHSVSCLSLTLCGQPSRRLGVAKSLKTSRSFFFWRGGGL